MIDPTNPERSTPIQHGSQKPASPKELQSLLSTVGSALEQLGDAFEKLKELETRFSASHNPDDSASDLTSSVSKETLSSKNPK